MLIYEAAHSSSLRNRKVTKQFYKQFLNVFILDSLVTLNYGLLGCSYVDESMINYRVLS